jgi:hypothetical protein
MTEKLGVSNFPTKNTLSSNKPSHAAYGRMEKKNE